MQLSWVNNGAAFKPQVTLGEAEDYYKRQIEAGAAKGLQSMLGVFAAQLDLATTVLARADPHVTREHVGRHVLVDEAAVLCGRLITEAFSSMIVPAEKASPEG